METTAPTSTPVVTRCYVADGYNAQYRGDVTKMNGQVYGQIRSVNDDGSVKRTGGMCPLGQVFMTVVGNSIKSSIGVAYQSLALLGNLIRTILCALGCIFTLNSEKRQERWQELQKNIGFMGRNCVQIGLLTLRAIPGVALIMVCMENRGAARRDTDRMIDLAIANANNTDNTDDSDDDADDSSYSATNNPLSTNGMTAIPMTQIAAAAAAHGNSGAR